MTDIVEKLRGPFCRRPHGTTIDTKEICERLDTAADEIDRLRSLLKDREAEIDKLREALEDLLSDADRQMRNPSHHIPFSYDKAKRALSSKERQS